MYLITGEVDRHIEEKNGSKYLVFDSIEENKKRLKRYTELRDRIEDEIKTINGGKEGKYGENLIIWNLIQTMTCHYKKY